MKKILLSMHVASAILQVLFFPLISVNLRRFLIQLWAKILLKILRINLTINGEAKFLRDEQSFLLVSNHISWLDIHVINSIRPVVFVAKSDVLRWPIFGYLAKYLGTIFLNREKLSDIKRVIHLMKEEILSGSVVAFFPEGTSSDGSAILPFKSNLFQAAVNAECVILPIKITYQEKGIYTQRTAFIGDMTLAQSLSNILSSNDVEVRISVFEPLLDKKFSRHDLCGHSYNLIK